ncbi:permease-like cell division protein FtsX [Dehalobacterium formicoaceticum]|uniref:Cell division protein FtsX n=1 Tax=Dehalobacterium formicoaceticum TaxID=51515 RepID=A0ABT1Y3C7_9FIRM|nr:permease-like cell division protein FtsX [Dehalobacterium formicoaceticum]MCR6545376.1 permease-like cell division protein FtsX [Dehalobacterium formicoaceticum]
MKLRTIGYFFKEAVLSLKRNGWMSVASIATVAISLFVCGVFLLLVLNVNSMAYRIESSIEISTFFQDDATDEEIREIQEQIQSYPGIAEVKLITSEQHLASLKNQFGDRKELLDSLGYNPLPDSLVINTKTADDVVPVAQSLENTGYFQKVRYGQGFVEKLFSLINWVRLLGGGVIILLGLAAVVLVAITIRLTVYARKKEITIMKYVGATDWFIRWPFFLEGIFLGLIGSLVAVLLLYWAYSSLLDNVSVSLTFIKLVSAPDLLWKISLGMILIGISLGAIGSVVSLRKFLKV